MLGVKRDKVTLAPHNDNWKNEYKLTKKELEDILGDNIIEINHVGSTAIKGIVAKPILDVAVVIKSAESLNMAGMEAAGFEYGREGVIPGRYYFARRVDGDISTHHIHCYLANNDNYNSVILFCRFLNENPEYAKQYNDLKVGLAFEHPDDRVAYGEAKTEFIEKIVALAKDIYRV